jgi:hypothetical protein
MNESERLEWLELRRNLTNVQAQLQTLPAESAVYAGTVYKGSGAFAGTGGKPRTIRVLHRGDVTSPRAEVAPGTVPIIPGIKARFDLAPAASEGERRAALAHWIVDPQNPLTWRSIVNRIWQHHMGRGLVATANDFGRMGDVPTHPALLDWLASEFRQTGSIKGLHRLIVTSATYRQASTAEAASPPPEGARAVESAAVSSPQSIDAGNQYYWRMNRRRLQAEELRDTVLMVAGRLDHRMGGPGFQEFVIEKPEHSPHYQYDLHSPDDPRSHRRSIYRFLVRSQQSLFMTTLDCADPSQLVAKRNETLTALQALALLNNKLMLAMSRHFAQRLERDEGTRAGGVSLSSLPRAKEDVGVKERLAQELHQAYQLALGRDPSDIELRELVAFAREHGLPNACRVIFNLNEFMFID